MALSKNHQIYDLIVERLVTAHYAFGERLLVKELGEETGASRQPIMSALNRLSVDGFVQIIPQVGCQVINPSRDEIGDFFLLFQRMEGLLAELASKRRGEEQLTELLAVQQRITAIEKDRKKSGHLYADLNRRFHNTVHLMAKSPLLAEKQRNNFNMSDFFISHSVGFKFLLVDNSHEHEAIIDAIAKQQPERARLAAEGHIAAVASAVLAGLDAQP